MRQQKDVEEEEEEEKQGHCQRLPYQPHHHSPEVSQHHITFEVYGNLPKYYM